MITGLTITDSLSLRLRKVSDVDACNRNDKLFNPFSLIPSTYCHYFHTLLIPSQELTFPWKPVAQLGFHPKFSILVYYSCPSSPICLEAIPSNPNDFYTKKNIFEQNIWQLSIKVRWWDTSLALWILAKVTTCFMESLHFLNIIFA